MSKPKSVKPPPLPAPEAVPDVAPEVEDDAKKKVRRQQGYQKQVLTGSLTPSTGKKNVLG